MSSVFEKLLSGFHLPFENPILTFSILLIIILLAPILLRRLNIPGLIVLIISGIIIGPYGFNIIENNSAIELFSTIGLLYIMFIAGLELDLNEFKANRSKSIVFGFLTFTIPILIGFPVIYYILDYEFLPSLLISSMFATHTLVAYPIVSKLGISKNQAVAITVGGTILTDTAVLLMLATIVGVKQGSAGNEFWVQLGISLIIFSAIMFFVVPRIAKWFFRKLESEKHSHYIFVLAIVFFAAFFAEIAGLEPIIGAFAAGLALNKMIPNSSSLMNRIEFIGNSLFIPFFLISVGMLVDISIITNGYGTILIAGILSVVALFGKWLSAFFTQVLFKYSGSQRQLIFGLSSSHAAAILAVGLVGLRAGLIDESILNGTIILILVSCIVASFVTERAAKRVVLEFDNSNNHEENDKRKIAEHIIIPVGSPTKMEKLIDFVSIFKDKKSVQPISLLDVVPNDENSEESIINVQKELESCIKYASGSETNMSIIVAIDHHYLSGVARKSREVMADTILFLWPDYENILDRKSEVRLENILISIEKTVYLCDIKKPLSSHKRIVIAIPPYSEIESDFQHWLLKTHQIATELKTSIVYFCNKSSELAISKEIGRLKLNIVHEFKYFENWEDFLILSRFIVEDDLLIVVGARKGSLSFDNFTDSVPVKLEKYFNLNSKLLIYPQHNNSKSIIEGYQDISHSPINLGIEAVQKIGKEIGNIFKKDD